MTSHFSTGTTRRASPAWCKPGMFGGIVPTVDGRPATINAYARWTGDYYGDEFNVIETIQLRRNPLNNAWAGESAVSGKRIKIDCKDTADPNFVNVTMYLYDGSAPYDVLWWFNVPTTWRAPWGTQRLINTAGGHRDLVETQLLG